MKINFWQVLGLLLIIVGVVLLARKRMGTSDVAPTTGDGTTPAAVAPAEPTTGPTTEPAPAAP